MKGVSLRHALKFSLLVLVFCSVPRTAAAQTDPIDTQRFRPHATYDGLLALEGAQVRFPVDPWSVGFWLNYGYNPLVIANDGDLITRVVSGTVAFDATVAYTVTDWIELGFGLPLAMLMGEADTSTACAPGVCPSVDGSEGALGDLRFVPKFMAMDDRLDGLGLALVTELRVPTHTSDFYGGSTMVVFAPRLVLDHRLEGSGLRLLGNLGASLRETTTYANIKAGSELDLGLGLAYRLDMGFSPVEFALDVNSHLGLAELDKEEFALETLGAVQLYASRDVKLSFGGGVGVVGGYGTPTFRLLGGLTWTPSSRDADGDGRPDHPEDERIEEYRNPDQDGDGKVDEEFDHDGDGKVDEGYDENGDGKLDDDAARNEAAKDPDKNGDGKVDPQYDKNGDGKLDKELDEDGDGKLDDDVVLAEALASGQDLCPDLPEDFDGIEDDDGCPEGDKDGDGVVDLFDRCPDEAEFINGFEDDDGCPDEGPAQVVVENGQIKVLATIKFKTNSDELEDESAVILDQLVLTIRARQDIRAVEIGGHTDSTGSHDLNMRLSQLRANSVKRYMVEHGIQAKRLQAIGYGPDKPIADNKTDEGRALNRRVEFIIDQR